MNEFVVDVINCSAKLIFDANETKIADAIVVSDECVLGDYIYFMLRNIRHQNEPRLLYEGCLSKNAAQLFHEEPQFVQEQDKEQISTDTICYYVIDCLDKRYLLESEAQKLKASLAEWCALISQKGAKLIACIHVPEVTCCPEGITALAEREYNIYLESKETPEPQEQLYLSVESIIRGCVEKGSLRANILRFDNILGPGCCELFQGVDIAGIVDRVKEKREVEISEGDQNRIFSMLSIRDCLRAVLNASVSVKIRPGHIYNVSGGRYSLMNLKMAVYQAFSDSVKLLMTELLPACREYHVLDHLKFDSTSWKTSDRLEEICYRLISYYAGNEYDMLRKLSVYNGRLPIIIREEKRILSAVEKICRENGIQFFLAGGSTLGAIRHKDVIPWDDDIDIGMLRPDYEKFRKIVPELLPDDMIYEAANGTGGSHYHFDKIRIRDTYFSTKYSSLFTIQDGIFLDVLVYDQTSNKRLMQTLQIRLTSMWTRVMNVKWKNVPMGKRHRISSRIALPFLRLFSWDWFHKMFDRIVRHYEHFSGSQYVIDSMGLNIKKGAMKKEWLEKVEYVPFGDMMMPVPAGYDGYLSHLYSSRYMEYLPISSRVSGHAIARLDLGDKLFDDSQKVSHLDIRGELYEEE